MNAFQEAERSHIAQKQWDTDLDLEILRAIREAKRENGARGWKYEVLHRLE